MAVGKAQNAMRRRLVVECKRVSKSHCPAAGLTSPLLAPDALGHWVIKTGSGDETRLIRRPVTWDRRVQVRLKSMGQRKRIEAATCRLSSWCVVRISKPQSIAAAIE